MYPAFVSSILLQPKSSLNGPSFRLPPSRSFSDEVWPKATGRDHRKGIFPCAHRRWKVKLQYANDSRGLSGVKQATTNTHLYEVRSRADHRAIRDGIEAVHRIRAEQLIVIGGGTTLDVGKAIAGLAHQEGGSRSPLSKPAPKTPTPIRLYHGLPYRLPLAPVRRAQTMP